MIQNYFLAVIVSNGNTVINANYETMIEWFISFTVSLLIMFFILFLLENMSSGRTELIARSNFNADITSQKIHDYLLKSGFKPAKENNKTRWTVGNRLKGITVYELTIEEVGPGSICKGELYYKPGYPFNSMELVIFSKYMIPEWYFRKKAFHKTNDFISFIQKDLEGKVEVKRI